MKITLNGQEKEVDDALTLTQLIEHVSVNNKRVIAEINGAIIKKEAWNDTIIHNGDNIELVTFVGGG